MSVLKHEAYTIWATLAPFRKNGTPVIGNMGSTVKDVVVMESETFRRLVREHPSLATAEFSVCDL
jgi:hypothetical protein